MKNQSRLHFTPENGWPNPDDIIKEYFESTVNLNNTDELNYPTWYKSSEIQDAMLPPSLWPITPESLANTSTFKEWG